MQYLLLPFLNLFMQVNSSRLIMNLPTSLSCFVGFAVAQCINQHNPSPLSSPSPSSGSGSTGRCDSVTASSTSTPSVAQSPSGIKSQFSALALREVEQFIVKFNLLCYQIKTSRTLFLDHLDFSTKPMKVNCGSNFNDLFSSLEL